MKKTFTFHTSIIASTASKTNDSAFDRSLDAFKEKDYKQSFSNLLDYIDENLRKKYGNVDDTEFVIPHGSIVVTVKIEDDTLKVTTPFLSLPEKNRLPLLRQVATLNFNAMDLSQLILKENKLHFDFSCPISLVEPNKIYYVLLEICRIGDRYDDEFISKFGATRICRSQINPYATETVENIYQVVQESCKEWEEAVAFFESHRQYGYAWNVTATTLLKILYYAHPKGQLLNDLHKSLYELDREDIPLPEVVDIGKQAIRQLQNITKEKLAEDLYQTETLISNKRRSNLKNIQSNLEDTFDRATEAIGQKDFQLCAIIIIHRFYEIYFYNNLQDDINTLIVSALKQSSAKPFMEAAPILYAALNNIMDGNLTLPAANTANQGLLNKKLKNIFKK